MRTFSEFVQNKNIDPLFEEAAQLLASLDVDPYEWVLDYARKNCDPLVETILIENLMLEQPVPPGPTTGAQQAPSPITQQPQMQQQTLGGMFQNIGRAIGDYFTGPQRRYTTAVRALEALSKSFTDVEGRTRQRLKTAQNEDLIPWMQKLVASLKEQAARIPGLIQTVYAQQQARAPQASQTVSTDQTKVKTLNLSPEQQQKLYGKNRTNNKVVGGQIVATPQQQNIPGY